MAVNSYGNVASCTVSLPPAADEPFWRAEDDTNGAGTDHAAGHRPSIKRVEGRERAEPNVPSQISCQRSVRLPERGGVIGSVHKERLIQSASEPEES